MYFKQKLAYMALGCLFTIIGYILASLSGNPVDAQGDKSSPTVIDEIVCRSLRVVNADGKTIVSIDTDPYGGYMDIRHASGEDAITMAIGRDKEGFVQVRRKDQKGFIQLSTNEYGGVMSIFNKGDQNVLQASVTENGGYMDIDHASGENAIKMGIEDTEKEGIVQVQRKDQKGLIQLGADKYGGSMAIFNKGGQNVLQASVGDMGGGIINTRDKHGYKTGRLP